MIKPQNMRENNTPATPEPIQWVMPERARKLGDVEVLVDIDAVDQQWKKSDLYIGQGGTGGIKDRYQRFGDWLLSHSQVEMPEMTISETGVSFTNGRHRFAYARDAGEKTISVAMPRDWVKKAKAMGVVVKFPV